MKKEPGGTLGKKSWHRCVQELCIHPSLKPIPHTGQGEPRWRTALTQLLCSWRLIHWWLCASSSSSQQWCQASPVLACPAPPHSSQLSVPSRGDPKLSTCPWDRGANSSSALPIWPPPGPLSSFSVLENATQGGKFHQAAELLAKPTKDLCIVCLIHGHFGIPHPKTTYKPHKSLFHLDSGLLFPPNAPWQAALLLPNHSPLISSF